MDKEDLKDFIKVAWWRFSLILVVFGLLVFVISHVVDLGANRVRDAACTDVLECIDLGVAREHCDTLYPRYGDGT